LSMCDGNLFKSHNCLEEIVNKDLQGNTVKN